jgi:hypothetical protein
MWKLKTNNHTLTLIEEGRYEYEIDLERCNSGSAIADWIFQVSGKVWATPEILGNLVVVLDHILDPQANFCSFENNIEFNHSDMKDFLNKRYKKLSQLM